MFSFADRLVVHLHINFQQSIDTSSNKIQIWDSIYARCRSFWLSYPLLKTLGTTIKITSVYVFLNKSCIWAKQNIKNNWMSILLCNTPCVMSISEKKYPLRLSSSQTFFYEFLNILRILELISIFANFFYSLQSSTESKVFWRLIKTIKLIMS